MTIRYSDRTVVNALLLSRSDDVIRVAAPFEDDVLIFTLRNDRWISENYEPVTLEFTRECCQQPAIPEETEFICSKPLARKLISMLSAGSGGDGVAKNMVYVFSGHGGRVRIQQSLLQMNPDRVAV
jgi:hypothetical protein